MIFALYIACIFAAAAAPAQPPAGGQPAPAAGGANPQPAGAAQPPAPGADGKDPKDAEKDKFTAFCCAAPESEPIEGEQAPGQGKPPKSGAPVEDDERAAEKAKQNAEIQFNKNSEDGEEGEEGEAPAGGEAPPAGGQTPPAAGQAPPAQ